MGPAADAVQERFLSEAVGTRVAKVCRGDRRQLRDVTGNGDGHGELNANNDYWDRIGSVHERLSWAVGWNRWRPDELDGAAVALDDLVDGEPMCEENLRLAADFVRTAQASDDQDSAIAAHRLVQRVDRALGRG